VGAYVGWTAKCVKKAFDKARGGVLFIDEAYSLVDDRDGSFGDEAINTIVQEMENNRQDVIVIFAGYPDKMQAFLAKNPGLRSRIAYHVPFDDYDTDALCKIAKVMAEQKGLKLTDGAMQRLRGIFDVARTRSDFGNGRFVRNMLENAKMLQASRLVEADYDKIDDEDVVTIIEDDIEMPVCFEEKKTVKLGFAS
jgi:SpoVK/Ycf46/Vps4 family AAA+-type ATPase